MYIINLWRIVFYNRMVTLIPSTSPTAQKDLYSTLKRTSATTTTQCVLSEMFALQTALSKLIPFIYYIYHEIHSICQKNILYFVSYTS